jgi:hypothetical protein
MQDITGKGISGPQTGFFRRCSCSCGCKPGWWDQFGMGKTYGAYGGLSAGLVG